jgi:hypothetical protein
VTWTAELSVYRAPEPDDPRAIPAIDNVQLLRGEYAYATEALWRELMRHEAVHGCAGGDCDLGRLLNGNWARVREMSAALDWVLGAELHFFGNGFPCEIWGYDYYAGPWPTLADGTVVR